MTAPVYSQELHRIARTSYYTINSGMGDRPLVKVFDADGDLVPAKAAPWRQGLVKLIVFDYDETLKWPLRVEVTPRD